MTRVFGKAWSGPRGAYLVIAGRRSSDWAGRQRGPGCWNLVVCGVQVRARCLWLECCRSDGRWTGCGVLVRGV